MRERERGEHESVIQRGGGGQCLRGGVAGVDAIDGGARTWLLPRLWGTHGRADDVGRCVRRWGVLSWELGAVGRVDVAGIGREALQSSGGFEQQLQQPGGSGGVWSKGK